LARTFRDGGLEVTLAAPAAAAGADATWSLEGLAALAEDHAAVVVPQGLADLGYAIARRLPADLPVVVDCYAPAIPERLGLLPFDPRFGGFRRRVLHLVRRGDLFLVANTRQRLFLLGLLAAEGRLNPVTIDAPPILEAPFGVPAEPRPVPVRKVARGVLVEDDAPLAVWFGGLYPWLDGVTAVQGFGRAAEAVPGARLAIVGASHPCAPGDATELDRTRQAIAELGLGERVIEAPWQPYEERLAWYAEADCAVCLSKPGIELELAHRTRLVDLIWGRVPIVSTAGDEVGDRAAAAGAGDAVQPGDATAAGAALARFLSDPEARAQAHEAAGTQARELAWPRVLAPLIDWLRDPHVAADRFGAASWPQALGTLVRTAAAARRGLR
jgi:glycosyltransferase involved in cell wall biosynthesis